MSAQATMTEDLLEVRNLATHFYNYDGVVKAVDGVSFRIQKGSVLGLVGESGCGKTVTALSIMNLVPPQGRIVNGQILFEGRDLLAAPLRQMRIMRGAQLAMIFQDPFSSLNPVFTVGYQIEEALLVHGRRIAGSRLKERVIGLLRSVEIPDAGRIYKSYPHTLSGGLRQRAMLAMALANAPSLLIADEPTTALDVTVQKEILDLLSGLKNTRRMAMLFIAHNFGIIARIADHVGVMYAGKIVEYGEVAELLRNPLHPYTKGLLNAIPRLGAGYIKGIEELPAHDSFSGHGCSFYPRCGKKSGRCGGEASALEEKRARHYVACRRALS